MRDLVRSETIRGIHQCGIGGALPCRVEKTVQEKTTPAAVLPGNDLRERLAGEATPEELIDPLDPCRVGRALDMAELGCRTRPQLIAKYLPISGLCGFFGILSHRFLK